MDVRNSLEGLKALLGVNQAAGSPAAGAAQKQAPTAAGTFDTDRATLSPAGSEVAQTAADGGVRMEKVAGVQAALQAGSYQVPAQAVAARMVDAMLGGER
jgi:flagellar biosynthesis anti-sigma factor FlgM